MQVPGHVVSMYVATCGQNGSGLGSDEKEVILLVYIVMDATTSQIVGVKQILVRPLGTLGKDRTISSSSDNSNSAASPPHHSSSSNNSSIHVIPTSPITNSCLDSQTQTNNNNNNVNSSPTSNAPTSIIAELPIAVAQAAGKPLKEAIEEFDKYIRSLSIDPESTTNFKLITDGQLPIRQCLHPEACAKDIDLPSYYCKFSDLRKEFVRFKSGDLSRALVPVKDIKKLLQAPATPMAVPQSIAEMVKELEINACDDSEFYIKESRDMASIIQAMLAAGHKFESNEIVNLTLEPGICSIDDEIDSSCIVRARGLPWQSSDQDIAKFFRGLNIAKGGVALCLSPQGRRNGEALIRFETREHREMALKRHKHHIGNRYIEVYRSTGEDFLAVAGGASNEAQAFLSKGAQVIIRMRGLPYDCTAKQVLDFFTTGDSPCDVLDGADGVLFVKKPDGRATGDAFVLFPSESDAPKALSRHRESIGQRYIELFRSTTAEVQQVLNRSMDPKTYEPPQPPLIAQLPTVPMSLLPQHMITSGTTKNCIRLRGLPYEALVEHILHFLDDFAKNIIYQGVHMVINAQGQPSGEAFIQMDSEEAARLCAQRKHTQFMVFGKKYRYIEVFQCSGDDMNMVLNGGIQSPVNHHPSKPSLLSPGMLPQPSQATPQTITSSHPSIQPATSVAAAAAASAAAHMVHPHAHIPNTPGAAAAAAAASVAASGGMSPYFPAQHPTAHAHHAPTVAGLPAHSPASGSLAPHHHSLQMASAGASVGLPFNLSVPPPSTNPALLAQQQAQFIAQQNLIARQQAAAAAVAHHNEQQMYANFMSPFMLPSHHPQSQAMANHQAAMAAAAGHHPQYFLMQRPYVQHLPIGYMPSQMAYPGTPTAAATPTSSAALPATYTHSVKRSYDNAFQQDQNSVNSPKRQLTRPPGNMYSFYNPGV